MNTKATEALDAVVVAMQLPDAIALRRLVREYGCDVIRGCAQILAATAETTNGRDDGQELARRTLARLRAQQ